MRDNVVVTARGESLLATHTVLRNTYWLLGLTLLFSAAMAGFAMVTNAKPNFLLTIVGVYGLMFLTSALRNSGWGLLAAFAFTGFMGYTLGPILNMVLHNFANGSQILMTALGATGVIFFALSAYVLTTRKNFSYLGGFLFVGVMVAFLASLGGLFFNIPALHLAVSAAFVLLSSGLILFHTSNIINGGERNYIMATISIYVALYNLFVSLLQLFSAFGGRNN
jgi:modulator of FtsH protease